MNLKLALDDNIPGEWGRGVSGGVWIVRPADILKTCSNNVYAF